jgi:tight adherence protein B
MAFVLITFVVTLAVVIGAYWLFIVRPEEHVQDVIWRRLKSKGKGGSTQPTTALMKRAQQLSNVPAFDALLSRSRSGLRPVEDLLQQSGTGMRVGTFVLITGLCGAVVAFLALSLTGLLSIAVPAGLFAATLPTAIMRMKRTRRILKFEEQFPEALALISRALKAGHTFTTGLQMVSEEMSAPIGPEYKLLFDEQNYGRPIPDALKEFANRVPLLDARFFVTAVLIQREAGGNLAEVLDNIASVIRDRFRVKRQIRVISAHARMTGWVLIGVPPALAAVLFTINPDHWQTLIGSPLGIQLIIAAIVLQITGSLIIRKMVRIEY